MPKLTFEQAASDYARRLGYDDYPATGWCPYNPVRSSVLCNAYWSGWRAARENGESAGDRRKKTVA